MGLTYNTNGVSDGLIASYDFANNRCSPGIGAGAQLIAKHTNSITINANSPNSGGNYTSLHYWNLPAGYIPRYSIIAVVYTVSVNTAVDSSGNAIMTGNFPGTQFGPGDIPNDTVAGVDLSPGTHVKIFEADGEYWSASNERDRLYMRTVGTIYSGEIKLTGEVGLYYVDRPVDLTGRETDCKFSHIGMLNTVASGTTPGGKYLNIPDGDSNWVDMEDIITPMIGGSYSIHMSVRYNSTISSERYGETYGLGTGTVGGGINNGTFHYVAWVSSSILRVANYAPQVLGGGWAYYDMTVSAPSANTWTDVQIVNSGTMWYAYINGELAGSTNAQYLTNAGSSRAFIGRNHAQTASRQSNIGFFKVYNKALSATEAKQNYNAYRGRYGI